jgi:hypothetical protein
MLLKKIPRDGIGRELSARSKLTRATETVIRRHYRASLERVAELPASGGWHCANHFPGLGIQNFE